jgi:hypothetical protein
LSKFRGFVIKVDLLLASLKGFDNVCSPERRTSFGQKEYIERLVLVMIVSND